MWMQAVALLTECLRNDLVTNDSERGVLRLQLGRHLQDLGQTSIAVQVSLYLQWVINNSSMQCAIFS